jgi:hypothetical protein
MICIQFTILKNRKRIGTVFKTALLQSPVVSIPNMITKSPCGGEPLVAHFSILAELITHKRP